MWTVTIKARPSHHGYWMMGMTLFMFEFKTKSTTNARLGLIPHVILKWTITTTRRCMLKVETDIVRHKHHTLFFSMNMTRTSITSNSGYLVFIPMHYLREIIDENWWMKDSVCYPPPMPQRNASYHVKSRAGTYNITMKSSFSILIHILHQKLPLRWILTQILMAYVHFSTAVLILILIYDIICDFKWPLNYPDPTFKLIGIV